MIERNKEIWVPRKAIHIDQYHIENPSNLVKVVRSFIKEGRQLHPIILSDRPNRPGPFQVYDETFLVRAGWQKIFSIDVLGLEEVLIYISGDRRETSRMREEQQAWLKQETI